MHWLPLIQARGDLPPHIWVLLNHNIEWVKQTLKGFSWWWRWWWKWGARSKTEVWTRGKTSIWYLSQTSLSLHTHEAPIGFWFLINIGYPCTLTSASVTISMVERQQCPIHCLTKTERSRVVDWSCDVQQHRTLPNGVVVRDLWLARYKEMGCSLALLAS